MLAAVAWLARVHAPFGALDHVPQLVSSFLDISVLLTPPGAAARRSLSLFRRVFRRVQSSGLDPILELHWLGQSLKRAIEAGDLPLVQYIHEIHPASLAVQSFEIAAGAGQLEILQWLSCHRWDRLCVEMPPSRIEDTRLLTCCFSYQCGGAANRNDQFHVLKWLYETGYIVELDGVGDAAASKGDFEMVRWLDEQGIGGAFSVEAMDRAARHGYVKIVQFLHQNRSEGGLPTTLMAAMVAGHSEVVTFLKEQNVHSVIDPESILLLSARHGRVDLLEEFAAFLADDESRTAALETAVVHGQVLVAQWLGKHAVSADALSKAVMYGHLDVLKWVLENDCGHWVPQVPAQAAMAGHLSIIQWFHANLRHLLTPLVMDCAASAGHLNIAKWLHETAQVGCSTDAMDDAATNGHLEVVQWLHDQGIATDAYTSNCMDGAAQQGHLELLMWLHEKGYNRISQNAMRSASLDLVMWLHRQFNLPIDPGAVIRSIALGDLMFLKWIHTNTTLRVSPRLVRLVLPLSHPHMVRWMREHRPEEAGAVNGGDDDGDDNDNDNDNDDDFLKDYVTPTQEPPSESGGTSSLTLRRPTFQPPHRRAPPPRSLMQLARQSSSLAVATAAPLASVACVVRECSPELAGIDHVVAHVDSFLDRSGAFSLVQAAAAGSAKLFNRAAARMQPPASDIYLFRNWLAKALTLAAERGHTEVVYRIHHYHPGRLATKAMAAAASRGDFALVRWLHENRTEDVCTPEAADCAAASGHLKVLQWILEHRVECFGLEAMMRAVEQGHVHIVDWAYKAGLMRQTAVLGDRASWRGHYEMVRWVHKHELQNAFSSAAMDGAASLGRLDIVHFLHEYRSEGCSTTALNSAILNGHTDVVAFLRANRSEGISGTLLMDAGRAGRLDLIQQYEHQIQLDEDEDHEDVMRITLTNAAGQGHLEVVQWIVQERDGFCSWEGLRRAALHGHLHILQWVLENECGQWTSNVMDAAAEAGHLEIVQWLHEHRDEGCSVHAMDKAAEGNHLDILQWLHANREEGCTMSAMDNAAVKGHLRIVEWLHENRMEGCTNDAMDWAATEGNLAMVQWLHVHRDEGCTVQAMDNAAQKGELEVIIWLHENRREGCTRAAMENAPLEVAQWIHANRRVGSSTRGQAIAAEFGDLAKLQFFHVECGETLSPLVISMAARRGHLHLIQWLHSIGVDVSEAQRAARFLGYPHVTKWFDAVVGPVAPVVE